MKIKGVLIVIIFFIANFYSYAQSPSKQAYMDTLGLRELFSFRPIIINNVTALPLTQKFDNKMLPFFCKIEHKIESKSKIAFRFRLGDLNYVNMLENKK